MQITKTSFFLQLINFSIAFFFVSILVFKGGYNISPTLLILLGLGYTAYGAYKKWPLAFNKQDKTLIYAYLFYFSLFVISILVHGGKLRELDNPSRILLLIPMLLLLLRTPIRLPLIIFAIPCGAIIAGLVALYDKFILQSQMAYAPRMMHIQAGDIAMSLGVFSLVSVFYFQRKNIKKATIFCLAGTLMGMLGSLLSTARGGWVGLPIILVAILWIYRKSLSKGLFISVLGVFILGGLAISQLPNNHISERFAMAQQDIQGYLDKQDGSTSVGARFDMWKSVIIMAQQKPILGWGIQGAAAERKKMADEGIISQYAGQFAHAHNQFLDDLSKRGIIGVSALLLVFLLPLWIFWKQTQNPSHEVKLIATLGVIHVLSVMCYCMSQGFFSHNSGNIFYFFLVVVFYAMLKQQLQAQHENSRSA